MNIGTRLRILILVTLLPVAAVGAVTAYVLLERQRETLERGARDRVRAIMTAIDTELRSSATPLELLARSPSLDRDDLPAFRAEAQRALDARGGEWANILVSDPVSGQMLLNLRTPPGSPPGEAKEDWRILRALSESIGRPLPFNSLGDIRRRVAELAPTIGRADVVVPASWGDFGSDGAMEKAAFTAGIADFYLTNPVARASAIMANVSAFHLSHTGQATGTHG